MNKPTKLLPTDLIAVEVPIDAKMFISEMNYLCDENNDSEYDGFQLEDKSEIIGEVTEDEINFDFEPYVEKKHFTSLLDGKQKFFYKNYIYPHYNCLDEEESFRSLLQANGLSWVNPIEKSNPESFWYYEKIGFDEEEAKYDHESYKADLAKWQEAESKLIKGKLIILKETK